MFTAKLVMIFAILTNNLEPFCIGHLQELEGLSSREAQRIYLPVTQEGELDALAVWFQLHLDEESSLSTGPQEDTCWEQAIYPVHSTKGT